MKSHSLIATALLFVAPLSPLSAETYIPTSKIGDFLRTFEKAYRTGDLEWIRSAVDKDGIIEEVKPMYFGLLGPTTDKKIVISDLCAVAAPEKYTLPNSLLDFEIESTIPVDFILTFQRGETTIRVPAGYRDGKIRLAGIKKKAE